MKIPLVKLKAILIYFCENTDSKYLGKVKLMKLFYFLDFMHLKNYGAPVTYDSYVNLEHGPIPSAIKNLVDTATDDIDNSVLSDTITFENPDGTQMKRILPLRKFNEKDRTLFSEIELKTLNQVCERFGDKNTKFIEDVSHNEAPWRETQFLDSIPYALAARDSDCLVSEDEINILAKITGV